MGFTDCGLRQFPVSESMLILHMLLLFQSFVCCESPLAWRQWKTERDKRIVGQWTDGETKPFDSRDERSICQFIFSFAFKFILAHTPMTEIMTDGDAEVSID